jgi:hypothetical protein
MLQGMAAMPLLPLKLWKSQHLLLVRGGTIVKETRDQAEKIRTNCQQVMRYR